MCLPVKPYKVEREWKHAGLSCAVVLAREAGHRCGYVRVPPGHSLHGNNWDDRDVDVHGGLTFSGIEPCTEHEDGQGYWFGFDCAHFGDSSFNPNLREEDCVTEEGKWRIRHEEEFGTKFGTDVREHYWTEPEVVRETEKLAEQLAAM